MNEEVAVIPIEQITDPKFLLRYVDKRTVQYLEMLDSIEKTGLWNSIAVRPVGDGKFEVIDGFYRLTCCRELGRESVPCIIRHGVTDEQVLAAQIRANAVRPETTTIEFARQLKRIQDLRPGITLPELAALVNKNPQWVSQQLNLLNLPREVQQWVDRGEIPMMSAYMLAKVPPRVCMEMATQARVMDTSTFCKWAAKVIKEFMEAVRQGKLDARFNDLVFEPQPHLRPLKEVVKEMETSEQGPLVIVNENARTPLEGFLAGLKWVANMDREGIRRQRQRYEAIRRKPDLLALYAAREDEPDEP